MALLVTIYLNKYLTMKNIILGSLLVGILSLLLLMARPTFIIASVSLFIAMGCKCVLNELLYSYLSVVSADHVRTRSIMLMELFFAFGVALLGVAYYVVRPWELALIFYQIIPSVLCFVLLLWWAEDSPL